MFYVLHLKILHLIPKLIYNRLFTDFFLPYFQTIYIGKILDS